MGHDLQKLYYMPAQADRCDSLHNLIVNIQCCFSFCSARCAHDGLIVETEFAVDKEAVNHLASLAEVVL